MKKILVIDDNQELLENTAEILELANYKVFTAENGKAGIESAMAHRPDLIICDIMMPELDGYGVLHMVQKSPELQDIPIIFVSAKNQISDVRKGMLMGADDYIPKPFDATDLLSAVDRRLAKSEQINRRISDSMRTVAELATSAAEAVLETFTQGRDIDKYKKKQRIYTEGNHPVRLFYVVKGKVKVFKSNDNGKELIVKMVKEGEFFGYTAMLENTLYRTNAEALEDSEIAAIPRSEFEELMKANPEVTSKFIKMLANDVADKEEQLIRIAYNSLRKKVADALLAVQKNYQKSTEKYNINLSRHNLAAVAATSTESLIRTLADFKAEHLIDIQDGKIAILNPNRLMKMEN